MTADNWQQVSEAFGAALALQGVERDACLATFPGPIRDEVLSLLSAHAQAGEFLESEAARLAPNTRIGPFLVMEQIGEGGMGSVYLARREQGGFDQRVALKIISSPLASADTERRFSLERQTLARLNHPNIVHILDGGEWQGRRYFAMEFVDGRPITEFARTLPLAAKLSLFRTVCAAIHFAHQNLIVHRDLKPGNILVTPDGEVKVLDFGIAKLLDAANRATTRVQPMSLDCASPEQVEGQPVTTATDVYALGVLLYHLLTGVPPQGGPARTLEQTIRQICRDEPPRPSSAAPGIGQDLDSIVLRAMRKDPAARYGSVAELSADVERYLGGRPVVARDATFWYVSRKFVARHRWAVTAALCGVVLLAGGIAAVFWQARVAARERALAQRRFEETRKLARSVIFDLQAQLANLPGSLPVRRQMIAQTLTYLESMARDAQGNADLLVDIAGSYSRVGAIQGGQGSFNLGDTAGALRSWQTALRVISPLLTDDRNPEALRLASTMSGNLAGLYNLMGKRVDSAAQVEQAVAFARRMERAAPGRPEAAETLGNALFFRATTLPDGPVGTQAWEETLQVYRNILAADPNASNKMRNVALCAKYLANALLRQDELGRAMQYAVQALELDEALLARAPANRVAVIDLSNDLGTIGTIYVRQGRASEAVAGLRRSLELRRKLAGQDPNDALLRGRLAMGHRTLAWALLKSGNAVEGRVEFAASLDVLQAILAAAPGSLGALGDVGDSELGMALTLRETGQTSAACRWFVRADGDLQKAHPENAPSKAVAGMLRDAAQGVAACQAR
jgi:eukaryotic-like serine/threonine-protein kinase